MQGEATALETIVRHHSMLLSGAEREQPSGCVSPPVMPFERRIEGLPDRAHTDHDCVDRSAVTWRNWTLHRLDTMYDLPVNLGIPFT